SWRSASALAAVAFVMAELIVSALLRKTGGVNFRKTQPSSPATIAKLIHLKISTLCSCAAFAPSSAACVPTAKNKTVNSAITKREPTRKRFIEPLSQGFPAAEPAARGGQFPRPVVRRLPPRRAGRRPTPAQCALSLPTLHGSSSCAHPLAARRARPAASSARLPVRRTPALAPSSARPDIASPSRPPHRVPLPLPSAPRRSAPRARPSPPAKA